MRVISTGNGYKIYDDSLKTYNELPTQIYSIGFSKESGFSLIKYNDIKIKEKTYGIHQQKVQKILNTFEKINRNLGIILSGDKGIGKSLFAKMLAVEGVKNNYPVIIVDQYIPGIADFLGSIEQSVFVIFDEFDKTFCGKSEDRNGKDDPQTEMLTLFDGIAQGKKMFIITCNKLRALNDYLVNRPGRFHYHLRFEYPKADEIKEYLSDYSIPKEEINKVITFSEKISLNYDCLRAIAFELQINPNFEDIIKDLNIVNLNENKYNVILLFNDGSKLRRGGLTLDLFKDNEYYCEFDVPKTYVDLGTLTFSSTDIIYDIKTNKNIIPKDKINWTNNLDNFDFNNFEEYNTFDMERAKQWKDKTLECVIIEPAREKDIHYTV